MPQHLDQDGPALLGAGDLARKADPAPVQAVGGADPQLEAEAIHRDHLRRDYPCRLQGEVAEDASV